MTSDWKRWGRGQVHSGEVRGYLFQSRTDSQRWMWKGIEFEATTPMKAIEMLMNQEVQWQGRLSG